MSSRVVQGTYHLATALNSQDLDLVSPTFWCNGASQKGGCGREKKRPRGRLRRAHGLVEECFYFCILALPPGR